MAALAGCVKTEMVPGGNAEVTFNVFNAGPYVPTTKAESLLSVDGGIESFKSKGFLHAEGVNGTQDFFGANGETISWNGTDHIWAPSHPYYWPKSSNSYVNFVSWYATDGTNAIAPTSVTESSFVINNRTIGASDNIMVANPAWRFNNNASIEYYRFNGVVNGVPTLFKHMLGKVSVTFTTSPTTDPDDANTTYQVTITSASIAGVYLSGTLSLSATDPETAATTSNWTAATANYLWTPTGNTGSITMGTGATQPQALQALNRRSVLPQELTENSVLNVTYSITTKVNNIVVSTETNITASVLLNTIEKAGGIPIDAWLPNKIYNYGITINPVSNLIVVTPTLESDWGSDTGTISIE